MIARRLLALLLLVVVALPARAASEREMSLEEMVGAADEVVVGEVLTTSARWEGRLIVTDAVVRVDEALKGVPTKTVTITELGGTAVHPVIGAPVTMDVSGESRLAPHERVVLFVEQRRPGRRDLVGGSQGKVVLRVDATTGATMLPVGPKRLRVERDQGRTAIGAESTTLDAFRERIRTIVGAPLR